jgi:hypothetical protein
MPRLLSLAAVLAAALCAQHFYKFMKREAKARTLQRRLEVWEGEGGAVPVSRNKVASQVSPSPRADR